MKLLAVIILLFSCSNKPETKGRDDEVLVFISSEDREILEPFIYDLFDEVYITPQEEKEFKVKFKEPASFNKFIKHPNLLCISIKNPVDSTGDVLSLHLVKEQDENEIIVFKDPYARNQTLAVINEFDSISALKSFDKNKKWIVNEYRDSWKNRILIDLMKSDRNEYIEEKINNFFSINIIIPKDYEIISSDKEKQFMWIGDDYPYKWIILYKEKNEAFISPKLALEDVVKKLNSNGTNISVAETGKKFKVYQDQEKPLKSVSGLFEHEKQLVGGPFYAFFREDRDSTIAMFSMVNNPGKEKMFYLKQFEVIFKSINNSY